MRGIAKRVSYLFLLIILISCSNQNIDNTVNQKLGDFEKNQYLKKMDINEYESYSEDKYNKTETLKDQERYPQYDQLKEYLESVVIFHDAVIKEDVSLWEMKIRDYWKYSKGTLLLAYKVEIEGNEKYLGVDQITGKAFSWDETSGLQSISILETPIVFEDSLSALNYVKENIWDPGRFTVNFDLKLYQNEDGEYFYKSERMSLGPEQEVVYRIDISESEDNSSYTAHCYEIITASYGSHTATTYWLSVQKSGFIQDTVFFRYMDC